MINYESHRLGKLRIFVCGIEEEKICYLNPGIIEVLMDMGNPVCLLCDIKYQSCVIAT